MEVHQEDHGLVQPGRERLRQEGCKLELEAGILHYGEDNDEDEYIQQDYDDGEATAWARRRSGLSVRRLVLCLRPVCFSLL